jgi:putative ABC transport system substrate-binding protein
MRGERTMAPAAGSNRLSRMSYGADTLSLQQHAAVYVDKILKGADPANLPVEQPMTFDLVVNMKTAQALGITFPNEIMLQVTEIIQ